MLQVRDEHAAGMSTKRSKRRLRDESKREHGVEGMKARTLPPVPFQPGLPQRHLCVPRQHLEGGRLPGAVHPQEAEALGRRRGVSSSPGAAAARGAASTHLPSRDGQAQPVHRRSPPVPVHLWARGSPHAQRPLPTGHVPPSLQGHRGLRERLQPRPRTLVRSFSSRTAPCRGELPTLTRSWATSWSSSPSGGSCRARGLGVTAAGHFQDPPGHPLLPPSGPHRSRRKKRYCSRRVKRKKMTPSTAMANMFFPARSQHRGDTKRLSPARGGQRGCRTGGSTAGGCPPWRGVGQGGQPQRPQTHRTSRRRRPWPGSSPCR